MEHLVEVAKPMIELLMDRVKKEIHLTQDFRKELSKLERKIQIISSCVLDKPSTSDNNAIEKWLQGKVLPIIRDMENMLDVLAYDKQSDVVKKNKLEESSTGRVRLFFKPLNTVVLRRKMWKWIKKIDSNIKDAVEEARFIKVVKESTAAAADDRLQQRRRIVDMSKWVGRDSEVDSLVDKLCKPASHNFCSNGLPVVAIVGFGGIGKTSLAKKIYDNEQVTNYFSERIWIHVSQDFNIDKILNEMVDFLQRSSGENARSEIAIRMLEKYIGGKRYLLVMDDVWNVDQHIWNIMRNTLERIGGFMDSMILVTTRDNLVAKTASASWVNHLSELPEDDSWSLFKQIAFANRSQEEAYMFEPIGQRIVQKCKGVPLAIKSIGGMLNLKSKVHEWLNVEKSELWDLPDDETGILPSLKLSYNHLPSPFLKKCFSLCALWPKGTMFEKYDIMDRWMALGLFAQSNNKKLTMEEICEEYFDVLLSISFLLAIKWNELGEAISYTLHDVVYDLARSVAVHERLYLEVGMEGSNMLDIQHLTVVGDAEFTSDFQDKLILENVRSLEIWKKFPRGLLLKHVKYLRVLSLINSSIEVVPESIARLKCLKYLDLTGNPIKELPECIMKLYHLQSLILYECPQLSKLPTGVNNLVNLRNLGLSFCLNPAEGTICSLRHLHTLPALQLSEGGFKISELGCLEYVTGKLRIKGLELIKSKKQAEMANMSKKSRIEELQLTWDNADNSRIDEEVLNALCPGPSLKVLCIQGYAGENFPSWLTMMDISKEPKTGALCNVQKIELVGCGRCEQLPTLGNMPCLKTLHISKMDRLRRITPEFYCGAHLSLDNKIEAASSTSSSSSVVKLKYFPSLKEFRLCNLPSLVEWCEPSSGAWIAFQSLEVLIMEDCPLLTNTPNNFPSLQKLTVKNITSDNPLSNILTNKNSRISLKYLHINEVEELTHVPEVLTEYCKSLQSLKIYDCLKLSCLPECLSKLLSLEVLEIVRCPNLMSLPTFSGLASLRELVIFNNRGLASVPEGMQNCCSLKKLWFYWCPEVDKLPDLTGLSRITDLCLVGMTKMIIEPPEWLFTLPSLRCLRIGDCLELNEFPDVSSLMKITSLKTLGLSAWNTIHSLPTQLKNFTALEALGVQDFKEMECLPNWIENLSSLQSLYLTRCRKLKEVASTEVMSRLTKLQYLEIEECPLLEESIKLNGHDHHKIASHVQVEIINSQPD